MEHKVPSIQEVKLDVSNYDFYHPEELDNDKLEYLLSVSPSYNLPDEIIFFIQVRILYNWDNPDGENKKHKLFHGDYLCKVKVNDVEWTSEDEIKINAQFLAHLLGMCFIMVRGAIAVRVQNNPLSHYPIPVLSPFELLEDSLEKDEEEFILKYQPIGFLGARSDG